MPIDYRHQTTLITGASSGLGVEFAHRLAQRGSHLVLVARRIDRLEAVAEELRTSYGVVVTPIQADLSLPGAGATLVKAVADQGLTVTGLINNAGFGMYGPVHDADPAKLTEMVTLNVTSLVDITQAFLADLRSAGNGILVNVASLAAYQPIPNMATYAATKSFVLSFTEALWHENRSTGLRVLALSPGATKTEFFDVVGTEDAAGGFGMQTSAAVIETAMKALDRKNGGPSVVSGGLNQSLTVLGRLLSRRTTVQVAAASTKSSAH